MTLNPITWWIRHWKRDYKAIRRAQPRPPRILVRQAPTSMDHRYPCAKPTSQAYMESLDRQARQFRS